jgi:hypothetical protein
MLRRLRRPEHDELLALFFDQDGEFFAVARRHVPRAAMRTAIVAHAGPLIGPYPLATGASVEIEKPGHASLLGSQTITTTRNEIDKSAMRSFWQADGGDCAQTPSLLTPRESFEKRPPSTGQ